MKLSVLLALPSLHPAPILPVLDKHYQWIAVAGEDIATKKHLTSVVRKQQPVAFVTVGDVSSYPALANLPFSYRVRWLHYSQLSDVNSWGVVNCYLMATLKPRPDAPVLFSFITSTYHSGEKLERPYRSLQAQTYPDWEWVVWDDSLPSHTACWKRLLNYTQEDLRISVYRGPEHSGFIGEMKRRACALARGEWLVELDHDDDLDPRLLEYCAEAIKQHPGVDFLCSDYVMVSEANTASQSFGDHYGYGYGANVHSWSRDRWDIVQPSPATTFETVKHLVGLPNHVRIWRRSFYEHVGRHNSLLPVADDYDLLVRSFLSGSWCRLAAPLYYQYNNNAGNNFTYLRNSLIQHLVLQSHHQYQGQLQQRLTELNMEPAAEPELRAWERQEYNYRSFAEVFTPGVGPATVGIVLVVSGECKADILAMVAQEDPNWRLYVIGNSAVELSEIMGQLARELPVATLLKIQWWNLRDRPRGLLARNYATRMLATTPLVAYAEGGKLWSPTQLGTLRSSLTGPWVVCDGILVHRREQLQRGDHRSTQEELVKRWESLPIAA
jgi:Glycosyl transferase family 2